jgi:hypothetical protein
MVVSEGDVVRVLVVMLKPEGLQVLESFVPNFGAEHQ